MNKFPILEIFGPTIQGEGMVIGQKTMFVRTAGCDYSCAWCDSAFTWDGSAKDDIVSMTASDIWEKLNELAKGNFSHVTISGGNPALLKNLQEFVKILNDNQIRIALETQGSVWQDWFLTIDDLTISPKPPSSKMVTDFQVLDKIISRLEDGGRKAHISLKVVVFDNKDYEYAKMVARRYSNIQMFLQVGNDDLSTIDDAELTYKLLNKYEWLTDKTMADSELADVKVLPQLHTLLWGNKRGV
ncbi:7-carboxy-7-deazaguanine synthase QueE [Salipaludibacillus keqinensis]|uniref:7-carboxy-7-deazaguanine synthase n=1 Tax=Salipaludibacillus keqinensis TaxID=2045207 RepID=A0A323TIW3_9BACI|nr:7-carboxy-7-deazaguanine synthase QueE [Salipaludibacillus keqinensis]PYZ95042.1 7-carboxy-7-deazaguanine synthase QueE [Salipaludibacillus keqinensis]